MAPPAKKQRTEDIIKPTAWLFTTQHRRTINPAAARPFAQPVGKQPAQPSHDSLTRQLAVKSLRLSQVVDENNKFRRQIEKLESNLTQAAPPAAPRAAPTIREQELEAALTNIEIQLEETSFELEAQGYFDNRARHYAYTSALTKALKTRPMHQGSRYLALRPTLPYRDLPEGPVIFSIPRFTIPKRASAMKQ